MKSISCRNYEIPTITVNFELPHFQFRSIKLKHERSNVTFLSLTNNSAFFLSKKKKIDTFYTNESSPLPTKILTFRHKSEWHRSQFQSSLCRRAKNLLHSYLFQGGCVKRNHYPLCGHSRQ